MGEETENLIGHLVHSTQGRDNGKAYLVWQVIDENFVLLVDGDARKIANPKKKRIKHIEISSIVLENIKNKILNNLKVFDAEIYSNIKKVENSNILEED